MGLRPRSEKLRNADNNINLKYYQDLLQIRKAMSTVCKIVFNLVALDIFRPKAVKVYIRTEKKVGATVGLY